MVCHEEEGNLVKNHIILCYRKGHCRTEGYHHSPIQSVYGLSLIHIYICLEVDIPRTIDFTYKDMKITVWCYCHKGIMRYSYKGYLGTRADILSDMVDRLLNSSNNYGPGRLRLQSSTYFSPSKDFYGRQLIYSCPEFNINQKL